MERLTPLIAEVRLQLNKCSELSQSGRHEEARRATLAVKDLIANSLLPDAEKLAEADSTAASALEQVRVLQCAALLAQALGEQLSPTDAASSSTQAAAEATSTGSSAPAPSKQQALYVEAKDLAESCLPSVHPMVNLARSLCGEKPRSSSKVNLPAISPTGKDKVKRSSPKSNMSPSKSVSSPSATASFPAPTEVSDEVAKKGGTAEAADAESGAEAGEATATQTNAKGDSSSRSTKEEKQKKKAAKRPDSAPVFQDDAHKEHQDDHEDHHSDHDDHHDEHGHREHRNLFAEYIAHHENMQQMGKPWFNNRQDDLRKTVYERARFAKLQNQGKNTNALADPKFTGYGHKLQTKELMKVNFSRSQPDLLEEVKRAGVASPEAFLTSKLRLKMDPSGKPMGQPKRRQRRTVAPS